MNVYLLVALVAIASSIGTAGVAMLVRRAAPRAEASAFTALTEGTHLLADISGAVKARAQADNEIRVKVQGLQALAAYALHQAEIASAALPPPASPT